MHLESADGTDPNHKEKLNKKINQNKITSSRIINNRNHDANLKA